MFASQYTSDGCMYILPLSYSTALMELMQDTFDSDSYAHLLPNRHRQVFIANVLIGSTCVHMANSSLRMPQVKTIELSPYVNLKQVCHNSVTGFSGDYIICMT